MKTEELLQVGAKYKTLEQIPCKAHGNYEYIEKGAILEYCGQASNYGQPCNFYCFIRISDPQKMLYVAALENFFEKRLELVSEKKENKMKLQELFLDLNGHYKVVQPISCKLNGEDLTIEKDQTIIYCGKLHNFYAFRFAIYSRNILCVPEDTDLSWSLEPIATVNRKNKMSNSKLKLEIGKTYKCNRILEAHLNRSRNCNPSMPEKTLSFFSADLVYLGIEDNQHRFASGSYDVFFQKGTQFRRFLTPKE